LRENDSHLRKNIRVRINNLVPLRCAKFGRETSKAARWCPSEAPICSTPKFKRWRQLPASPTSAINQKLGRLQGSTKNGPISAASAGSGKSYVSRHSILRIGFPCLLRELGSWRNDRLRCPEGRRRRGFGASVDVSDARKRTQTFASYPNKGSILGVSRKRARWCRRPAVRHGGRQNRFTDRPTRYRLRCRVRSRPSHQFADGGAAGTTSTAYQTGAKKRSLPQAVSKGSRIRCSSFVNAPKGVLRVTKMSRSSN
jgi:hypothetical protein